MRLDAGKPDMRKPIKFALYECDIPFDTVTANSLDEFKDLHFHDFDIKRYPIVKWAEVVVKEKGIYGAVFNASNEVTVKAFLNHEIPFLAIEEIVDKLMKEHKNISNPTFEKIAESDKKTRKNALILVKERRESND